MKTVKAEKPLLVHSLEIGKRYWLDSVKDVSGIFIGLTKSGTAEFNSIEGDNCYLLDSDDHVRLGGKFYDY